MRKFASLSSIILTVLTVVCVLPNLATAQQPEVVDNQKLVEMVRAGLADSVIITKIRSSRISLNASEAALLDLKAAGVSDAMIVAMMEHSVGNSVTASTKGRTNRIDIPEGTEVKIVTTDKISGKKVVEGQELTFKVLDTVKIDGIAVIEKDTIVRARVTRAKKPGMMGRTGRLSVSIESTTAVDGQGIKLRSAKSGKEGDRFGTAATLSVFWGVGLLMHGKNAEIQPGTLITAYTDEGKAVFY